MDSVNEELFEEVFRDIASVSEELPEDPFVEVHVFQGGSVVYITRSQKKVKQFSLVINDQVEFESIEPPKRAFPFPGKFLEGFMLLFSFDMAALNGCRIDKRNTSALPQRFRSKEDSKRYTNLSLEFYEAVVRRSMWKILLHMCSDKEIEML